MLQLQNDRRAVNILASVIMMHKLTPIFDLDGVLLDASHRQNCNPDGSLNLAKYIEDATYNNVMQDKALPLLQLVHDLNTMGIEYHIATARPLCQGTQDKLSELKVNYKVAIHRGDRESNDTRKDYALKVQGILDNWEQEEYQQMMLIDDNLDNLRHVKGLGLATCQIEWNHH